MCHMSRFTCQKYFFLHFHLKKINPFFYTTKNIGPSSGASRWRVCYQRGLPRLGNIIYTPYLVLMYPMYSVATYTGPIFFTILILSLVKTVTIQRVWYIIKLGLHLPDTKNRLSLGTQNILTSDICLEIFAM